MKLHTFPIPVSRHDEGCTLVEVAVAAVVMGIFFSAVAATYSTSLGVLRAQRETIASNLLMQERLEQVRANGWAQVTDATTLQQNVLGQATAQEPFLAGFRETITVSAYPPASPPATPLKIERASDGTVTILSQPTGSASLREMLAVRVDLRVQWTSQQNHRTRLRETSAVIAGGGMLR